MTDQLYEKQLNFVEDILDFHPNFIDVLDDKEKLIFKKYFQPDWNIAGDFKKYRKELNKKSPGLEIKAQEIFRKFLIAHHVEHQEELLAK